MKRRDPGVVLGLFCLLLGCSAQEQWVSGDTVEGGAGGAAGAGGWSPTAGTGGWSPTSGAGGAGSAGTSGSDASVSGSGGTTGTDAGTSGPAFQICADDAGADGDAATGGSCLVVGDLRAQVRIEGVTEQVRLWLKIVNTGSTSYPLDGVSLRYYYTVDSGSTDQTMDCWYAPIGCSSFDHAFVPVSGRQNADHYLELSFTSGSVPAGGDTGDIQLGFHKSDWARYDGGNDWSYYPEASNYVDAETVPLYLNGTVIWGIEPPAIQ